MSQGDTMDVGCINLTFLFEFAVIQVEVCRLELI